MLREQVEDDDHLPAALKHAQRHLRACGVFRRRVKLTIW
jgi:hypothetical protein